VTKAHALAFLTHREDLSKHKVKYELWPNILWKHLAT